MPVKSAPQICFGTDSAAVLLAWQVLVLQLFVRVCFFWGGLKASCTGRGASCNKILPETLHIDVKSLFATAIDRDPWLLQFGQSGLPDLVVAKL